MMGRRPLLIVAALAVLAAGLWLYLARDRGGASTDAAGGPIVFISIDTLRADRLPAYGYTGTVTPAIDRLVADGVLFENAYAHSPQTLPSHTSILSGELPFQHGVRDNVGFEIKPAQRFLQHALRDAGFATGGFVSSYVLRRQVNFNLGFDHYDDDMPPAGPDRPLGQMQRAGMDTLAAATKWVDGLGGKFFLFFHIYEPHRPYTPPAHVRAGNPYDGEVEYADEIVGKLLDRLREKGLYDDATIVLFSDHGEGLGDHGEDEHGIFLYRETTRVPLVIKLPGSSNGGKRVAAPVQHVDLVPTVLDLLGLASTSLGPDPSTALGSAVSSTKGRSLVPVLSGEGTLAAANIYSESLSPRYHFGWSELYALSDERYRLIRAPKDELYDLTRDPKELTSIAAERGPVAAAMRAALDAMIADAKVSAPSAVSDEDRQKLAALGYVGTQTGSALQLPGDSLPDPKDKVSTLQLYRRAGQLAGEQKHAEAAALFRQLLITEPGMTDVWLQLAETENRSHHPGEALAAYGEVIRRDPKNAAALTGATAVLLRAGRIEEARAHAELTIAVAPAIAHETLARIAVHRKQEAAARRHAQLAERADSTLPMTSFIEGLILHGRGDYPGAARQLLQAKESAARRTEQIADLNYLAGDSLARMERHQEAESLFRAELALFPSHVPSHTGLAMLYKSLGRDRDAERAIEELLRNSPTPAAIEAAAQLWIMFGEPQKAGALRARLRGGPG